jgi:hypothetical protein
LLDVDAAKNFMDSLANAIAETGTNTNIKDTLKLDIPIESIYVNADGNIVVVSTNHDGSITETVLTPYGGLNNIVVMDKDGSVYEVDEQGDISQTINELLPDINNDQPIDTAVANQKVKDLIIVLQQRIKEHLNNSTGKYPKLAYENESVLSSITELDPNIGGGGQYRNGRLYIGRRNFKENSADEDILATIYHEYMHYLNWHYGDRYRMADMETGEVYFIKVRCYEERMQTEDEFLDDVYLQFYTDKLNSPDATVYLDYPVFYKELNDIQKNEVDNYIKEKDIEPKVKCIPYDYFPSNYHKDEINAHTETLNAHKANVFTMSDEKIGIYNREINRYTDSYNKAKMYEIKNNINSDGYEK